MKRQISVLSLAIAAGGCNLSKKVADAKANADSLQEEYQSYDLSCSFEKVSADDDAEKETALRLDDEESNTDTSCENTDEQYAVMVDQYDSDGDGELSDEELAEAKSDWEKMQKTEVDADGDGSVSQAEKEDWRAKKLPARKEKLNDRFADACADLGKGTADCHSMRDGRKDKVKEHIEDRKEEFDTNHDGELSESEREAMRLALGKERDQRRDDFEKKQDKDGDGKLGPTEREERRGDRAQKREEHRPEQAKGAPPPPAKK